MTECGRYVLAHLGLEARKPNFAACEQQRRRPACASAQSDQRLSYSLYGKYNSHPCSMENFHILSSLCSRAGWFEPYLVRNFEDMISCIGPITFQL